METVFVALLVFGVLVVFHEFGHFGIAKLVGIKVHEFAIGMGPRILKLKGSETEYSIRIFPIGGYVKMEGEDEASQDERSFNNKPLWARILVIIAGPFMNFILAILLFAIIFYSIGFATTTIDTVTAGFPAELAGIKPGDKIISIEGEKINSWDEIVKIINTSDEKTLEIVLTRNDIEKIVYVKPVINNETKQIIIGISPTIEKSFADSIKTSFNRVVFVMEGMLDFFVKLFGGKASAEDVVGPVGIIHLVGQAAKTNIYNVLSLAALISVNLGIVNLLPIPALDGGRLVFLLIEGLIGKPLDPEKEGVIHLTGFILLMGLMLFMVYKDIVRFF
ncbi:RIP metalloprotease RseP [Clostridiaceae bacterium 35-E11]